MGLFPVLISLIANVTLTKQDAIEAKHQELRSLSVELTRSLSRIMQSAKADLDSITTNPVLTVSGDNPDLQIRKIEEFRRLKKIYTIFDKISLLDLNGFELDSTDENYSGLRDSTKWFRSAIRGDAQMTLPEYEPTAVAASVKSSVFKPIKSSSGKVLGVVRGVVRYTKIWELLEGVTLGQKGYVMLASDNGKFIFHPDKDKVFKLLQEESPLSLSGPSFGTFTLNGKDFIFDISEIPEYQTMLSQRWYLIAVLPYQEAVDIATRSSAYQFIVAFFSLSCAAILGLFLSRRVSSHIDAASAAAASVAAGNLDSHLAETGPAEIAALAHSFNKMAGEVKSHRLILEAKVAERTKDLATSREDLAALAAQLKAAFEASRSAILLLRSDGQLLAANAKIESIFGFDISAKIGTSPATLAHDIAACLADPEQFLGVWERANTSAETFIDIELELLRPAKRTVNLYSAPVRRSDGPLVARIWSFRDMTEQRGLEMGLRQAQKMEAVGRLAGGVAHDFNNLLQAILGNISLIEQDVGSLANTATSERISMARHAGERAAQIVRQLLSFSRLSHLHLSHCKVNQVIQDLHSIIRSTFDPRVEVTTTLQEDTWKLRADATQIEQVVMNMVVNARDAMNNSGHINISTRNIHLTELQLAQMPGSRAGDFVRISVTDNGSGMPPEVLSKIFEPFFTTKEQGKGTGLGLATSFGIVQQHGGWIACDSMVGTGTTFHIFLPRSTDEERAPAEAEVVPAGPVKGGGETILLVDDEMIVRAVAQGLLKKLGYNVITADDGEAALEILARMDGGIQLCLLDLTMPRLSGKDTFTAMRRGPSRGVPVVICSGYLVDLDAFAGETGSRPDAFVQKPYALDDLARCIRSVLDTPPVVAVS